MIVPSKKQKVIYEGRIGKILAVVTLIMIALCLGVRFILPHTPFMWSFWEMVFDLFLLQGIVYGILTLWMAGHEKLLFEDEQITYVSGKERICYAYRDIHTVFILRGTNGRGPIRYYLIIPVGESTAEARRKLEKTVSNYLGRGESRRMKQGEHLFCSIRNEKEKEKIIGYLSSRVNIIRE